MTDSAKRAIQLAEQIINNLEGLDAEIVAKALVVALAYVIDDHWQQDTKDELVRQCSELLHDIVFDRN